MSAPKHIGIILDGNRRFAKKIMLKPWKGHELGAGKFKKFLEWCLEAGVEEVTAYCFSIQNFNRPKEEFDHIMRIASSEIESWLEDEKLKEFKEKGVAIRIVGRVWMLPERVQELARKIMEATKNNTPRKVNLALAYGGREEIIDAVKKIAKKATLGEINPETIGEAEIWQNLQVQSPPDIIIRTGGERRTSNFLPWQGTYSELIFLDKHWPEIEKQDFLDCIEEFKRRERRFGK
ncbi:di-trans,poly-cis-decaprenylcistransferase [Candidatus Woesearchaeota archaeon]|nr:MAG: di-trans,poly-cis-decaprenylcistransferase [Candidatus Woesearchaeota archaeon]